MDISNICRIYFPKKAKKQKFIEPKKSTKVKTLSQPCGKPLKSELMIIQILKVTAENINHILSLTNKRKGRSENENMAFDASINIFL